MLARIPVLCTLGFLDFPTRACLVMFTLLLLIAPVAAYGPGATARESDRVAESQPLHWTVSFDASSIEQIILRPEEILADVDGFWASDDACLLVKTWHRFAGIPIPMDRWKRRVEGYSAYAADRREQQRPLVMVREIMSQQDKFLKKALPHIGSFLPSNGIEVEATVYLTAGSHAHAFQVYSDVVIDPSNLYWLGSSARILNILVHEVFHLGFGANQPLKTECDLADQALNTQLISLQNEGLATYVAFTALPVFPSPGEKDYAMLEDEDKVRKLRGQLNGLFSRAGSLSAEQFTKEAWNLGVNARAYYVVGAHMARVIDERRGREALVQTIKSGPRSFIRTYNALVDEDERIFDFSEPGKPPLSEQLRISVAREDYGGYARLLADIRNSAGGGGSPDVDGLIRIGEALLRKRRADLAIDLLKFCATRFADSAAAHHFLGEAYAVSGRDSQAVECFQKAVKLQPDYLYSVKALRKTDASARKNIRFPVAPVAWIKGKFNRSEGIAFTKEGQLYVTANSALWRIDLEGEVTKITDLYSNLGLAPIGQRDVLVADFGPTNAFVHGPNDDGIVWRVTPEGTKSIVARGIGDPNFILVLGDGSFLVSDDATDEIFKVAQDATVSLFTTCVNHPNGLALSKDESTLYIAQIFKGIHPIKADNRLWALDLENGRPKEPPRVVATSGPRGANDGLVTDVHGRVYVAANGGGKIWRYDPRTEEMVVIAENVPSVASLAFGRGEFDHHTIFATSTRQGGGTIWKVNVGVEGAPLHH